MIGMDYCEKHDLPFCSLCTPKAAKPSVQAKVAKRQAVLDACVRKPVYDLAVGDFVTYLGDGKRYKRYVVNAKVEDVYMTKGARTRLHLKLEGIPTQVLRAEYPVYVR